MTRCWGVGRPLWAIGAVAAFACLAAAPAAGAQVPRPGDIIVGDLELNNDGGLILIDPVTGKQSVLSANNQAVNVGSSEHFDDPYDATVTPGGAVLAAEEYAPPTEGSVIRVDPATGKQHLVSSNEMAINAGSSEFFLDPWGVIFLPGHGIVVSDYNAFGDGALIGVDSDTGKQSVFSSNDQPVNMGSSELFDGSTPRLAVTRSGEVAVVTGSTVVGVDPATGKQRLISSNDQPVNMGSSEYLVGPDGIDVGPDGTLYVVQGGGFPGGGVIGVDPATGKQSKVSANDMAVNSSNMIFSSPDGIATAPDGDLIVVESSAPPAFGGTSGAVIRVDPQTGAQALLSSNDMPVNDGSSELLNEPYGVTVVPPRCAGRYATAFGDPAGQKVRGGRFNDVVATLGGADGARTLGGADRACGGAGNDTLRTGKGADILVGGPGHDVCIGGPGRDQARGCEVRRSI